MSSTLLARAPEVIAELTEALEGLVPQDAATLVGKAWLRQFEASSDVTPGLPGWVKKKPCNTCDQEIFFAKRPISKVPGRPTNAHWIAVCPVPIVSDQVILDAISLIFSGASDIVVIDAMPGVQWLPHHVVCNMYSRPTDPVMAEVWDKTIGKTQIDEDTLVASLLKIVGDSE